MHSPGALCVKSTIEEKSRALLLQRSFCDHEVHPINRLLPVTTACRAPLASTKRSQQLLCALIADAEGQKGSRVVANQMRILKAIACALLNDIV